jgi:hypothetical protein
MGAEGYNRRQLTEIQRVVSAPADEWTRPWHEHGSRGRGVATLLAVALLVAGCGLLLPTPTPAGRIDPAALAAFPFIRDDAGLLSPAERERTEVLLRDIAARTGVFGVVITVGRGVPVDPPVLFRPVIEEIVSIGGEALVNICTPESCGLDASAAHTNALAEAVSMTAPAPEPAPGQGLPVNPGFELRRWVEYVGAVATSELD